MWSNDPTITSADVDFLRKETDRIPFPPQVTHVDYVVFSSGADNLNDTTLAFATEQRRDLINATETKWAPGHLIAVVSLDPRRNGIYCGDDVCSALQLAGTSHLDYSLDAMKPSLRQGNIAAGLFEGVKAASDPTLRRTDNDTSKGTSVWWLLLGGGSAALLLGYGIRRGARQGAELTKRHNRLITEWSRVAHQLDDYDIRANSLTSVFADAQLRHEWTELRDGFVAVEEQLHTIPEAPTEQDLAPYAQDLTEAERTLTMMKNAQNNIDVLYDVEHGDVQRRIIEATKLHLELQKALRTTDDTAEIEQLRELDARALLLRDEPERDTFLDDFALLIADIAEITEAIAASHYSDTTRRSTPKLTSYDWSLGTGYHDYVPLTVWETWHDYDHAPVASASDGSWGASSSSTSYSSGGFSGGGGSSSW
ncbi:DUF5129 domain-containing protein [Corynebacterium sp. 13CS0277]|uniref:DUF5129 domain-containing protein n=1 Tax=Corynebacterium sp. 13CS0277 TaxID=2071994 RepID=UPI00130498C3|nr:DUF5129 domain-containing protein [Corynebacterium sp. 13CS0277]